MTARSRQGPPRSRPCRWFYYWVHYTCKHTRRSYDSVCAELAAEAHITIDRIHAIIKGSLPTPSELQSAEVHLKWKAHALLNIDPAVLEDQIVAICVSLDVPPTPEYRAECLAFLQRVTLYLSDSEGGDS
jgi:hypothetical protein